MEDTSSSSIPYLHDEKINKTHFSSHSDFNRALQRFKDKIKSRGDLPYLTVEEQYTLIEDLASFPLGRHIILTGGANGIWTDYIISPQDFYLREDSFYLPRSLLECFIIFYSPVARAQRELFILLQQVAQTQLQEGKIFASIPCGVMRDFLTLDFTNVENVKLVGIDIDPASIKEAKKLASALSVKNVNFFEKNAWNLGYTDEFDLISSIGLNMYEPNTEKIIELYQEFYKALKPGGILFTGVLTWPPYIDKNNSDWNLEKISKYNIFLEEALFKDLLDIKWLNFRKLSEIEKDFRKAGFSNIQIHIDSCCVFPAVIAIK